MPEDQLRAIRHASLTGLKRNGDYETEPRLRCALCDGPVHISMWKNGSINRWFSHHGKKTICPYRTEHRLSPDQLFAMQYHGQQESAEHKRLKSFIADWIEKEPGCEAVWRDKVRVAKLLETGEWKRPDVRAQFKEREIVFEIQLSYTFLSEVIRRDTFYRNEQTHILWIFREFEPHREVVRDELFYNRRNIFVLDQDAERETIKRGRLTLKCYYQTPVLIGSKIEERWHTRFVHIDELQFPTPEYRPYFRDYDALIIELYRIDLIRQIRRWGRKRKKNIATHSDEECVRHAWHRLEVKSHITACEVITRYELLFIHLPKMLTIKYGKPIFHNYKTLWESLNAILAMANSGRRPYVVSYLMALQEYNPKIDAVHAQRIAEFRNSVIASIKAGDDQYLRDQRFEKYTALVLPELKPRFAQPFGLDMRKHSP